MKGSIEGRNRKNDFVVGIICGSVEIYFRPFRRHHQPPRRFHLLCHAVISGASHATAHDATFAWRLLSNNGMKRHQFDETQCA